MAENDTCANIKNTPFLITADNLIAEVSKAWYEMTSYEQIDILHKPIEDVLIMVLKVDYSYNEILKANGNRTFYIFTKQGYPREVYINIIQDQKKNTVFFTFNEKQNSRIEDKFMYIKHEILQNRAAVAIYSLPDLVLLAASRMYINQVAKNTKPGEDIIGKRFYNFSPKWTMYEKFWTNRAKLKDDLIMHEALFDGRYWNATLIPISENDEPKYYIVKVSDCTENVLYRQKMSTQSNIIIEQNEELEAILDNMSDILTVVDKYGNYTKMNRGALELDPELLVGMLGKYSGKYIMFDEEGNELQPCDYPVNKILVGKAVSNQKVTIKSNDNELVYDVNGTAVFDNDGNIKYGVLCSHDITNIDKQVKTIESHKKELELLIENINEAIFIIKEGNLYLQNKLARDLFCGKGFTKEILNYADIYDSNFCRLSSDRLPSERVLNGEVIENEKYLMICHTKPENRKVISVNANSIYDENNKMTCFISVRDITEIENKEEIYRQQREKLLIAEMDKAQALEKVLKIKEEFLATISHEFKTPLTVINAILQTLDKFYEAEMTDKVKSYLNKIRQNSFRQLRLVNNLVDITRVNSDQFKIHKRNLDIVFLTKSIVESVQSYAHQKGVGLQYSTSAESRIIGMDEAIFERILLNLLSNAIKFTPAGKSIYVEVNSLKTSVVIKVRDEGIGIPPEKKEIIFERFGQVDSSLSRQAEGSGIGLSLVRTLVTALGGKIELNSVVNKGSTFKVTLPSALSFEEPIANEKDKQDIDGRLIHAVDIEFSDIYTD